MANVIYVTNLKETLTGAEVTDDAAVERVCLDVFARNDVDNPLQVAGSFSSTNSANGPTGDPVPAEATMVGFEDPSGDLQAGQVSAAGNILVDGSGVTQPISAASLPLPTGASTAAKQPALGTAGTPSADVISVQGVAGGTSLPISAASLPLPTGAATAAKQPALGTAGTASADVISVQGIASMTPLLVNGSGVTQPISAAALPLPTGAATEATLASVDGKLVANFGAATGAIRTAAQLGNAAGSADFNAGNASAQTVRVVVATDQAAIASKSPVNTNGAIVNTSLTATTASTATVPANAVGFLLEAPSTNTDNIRWCVGGTASTTVGMLTEPGRDSGFIPCAANISVCATVSGTNAYSIQWVLSS